MQRRWEIYLILGRQDNEIWVLYIHKEGSCSKGSVELVHPTLLTFRESIRVQTELGAPWELGPGREPGTHCWVLGVISQLLLSSHPRTVSESCP